VGKKTISHVGLHLEIIVKRSAEIFYHKKQVEGLIKWNEEYMGSDENVGSVLTTIFIIIYFFPLTLGHSQAATFN
jgi:hypothetical protein